MFEDNLLDFTELAPEARDAIRAELVATALVKIDAEGGLLNDRPYLRFHPPLPYAAHTADVPDADAAFQRAGDLRGEMQTSNLLAIAELERGQFDAVAAWYARSHELALKLNDRDQLASVAQNAGILAQNRAEWAADPAARSALLREAVALVAESLAIKLELQNQVGASSSYFQLD